MKCLFIYLDGREELRDQPTQGLSEAGQELPPRSWELGEMIKAPYSFTANPGKLPDLKDNCCKTRLFRIRVRTAYELLPVYKEIP